MVSDQKVWEIDGSGFGWAVYRNGAFLGRFATHARALAFIEATADAMKKRQEG